MNSPLPPLLVANWKMQLTAAEAAAWVHAARAHHEFKRGPARAVICPSFTALARIQALLVDSGIKLGAQDVFWDARGAYTGEVSARMLQEVGVEYVILGHSERRHFVGETDEMISKKMLAAYAHRLMPILCVGETAHQRAEGQTETVVRTQLEAALRSMPPAGLGRHLCITYEPVWAIHPGGPATPEQTFEILAYLKQLLVDWYGPDIAEQSFRMLYGGSVAADNVGEFVRPEGFSGALVGTASLEPDSFAAILGAVNKTIQTA